MMVATPLVCRLCRDRTGATTVEFAILAPVLILLMIAVLQIGMAMQSYNAIRNVAADTARFAVVEYQRGSAPSAASLEAQAHNIASGVPYLLQADALTVHIEEPTLQRVDGVREMTLTVRYTLPAVLPLASWASLSIDFSRPIFVLS
jgi:Flp pilus assembly pilin Flp